MKKLQIITMTFARSILVLMLLVLLQACATTSTEPVSYEWNSSPDPLEGINRKIYDFNTQADKIILRPVAKGYDKVVPKPAQKGVSNFFSNLNEPINAVNNLLQGKVDGALDSTYRFVVNSTVGLLGLMDVAKNQGVEESPEDFGQTLAKWGVKPGPYLMLPLLGPSNLRDGFGRGVTSSLYYPITAVTDSGNGQLGLLVLDTVNTRASLLGIDSALDKQLDPYLFIKNTIENTRTDAINDGAVVEEEFDF